MKRVRTIFTHTYPYPHEHSRHAIIAVVVGCLFFISSDNMHTLIDKLDQNIKWWSMYSCLLGFFYFFSSPFIGKTIKPSYSNFSRWWVSASQLYCFCFILTFNTSYPCICALGNLSYWCFQVHSLDFSGSCVSSSKFSVNGSGYKDESFNVHNDIHLFHSVSCSISCSLYWPLVHWFGLTCCWKEAWAFGNFSELCCKFCGCLLWFTIKFSFPTLLYQFLLSFMV